MAFDPLEDGIAAEGKSQFEKRALLRTMNCAIL